MPYYVIFGMNKNTNDFMCNYHSGIFFTIGIVIFTVRPF